MNIYVELNSDKIYKKNCTNWWMVVRKVRFFYPGTIIKFGF